MKALRKVELGTSLLVSDLVTKLLMFLSAMSFVSLFVVVGLIFQMLAGSIDSAFVDWFAIRISGG